MHSKSFVNTPNLGFIFGFTLATLAPCQAALADGLTVDKVYDPYVQPLERELEYRLIYDDETPFQIHKAGYGQAINDRVFVEGYAVVENGPNDGADWMSAEVEAKWQLTEQGEYSSDWGLMFELEREFVDNGWEASVVGIVAHEWGQWQGLANLSVVVEWGSGVKDEVETEFSGQIKYRYQRNFEPGWEVFSSQDTTATGPVIMGNYRLQGRKSFFWQAGIYTGLDTVTPDTVAKVNLELEF